MTTATSPGLAQGAIQAAVYGVLHGDATLAALAPGGVFDAVPEPTIDNYVAIGEWTEEPDDTFNDGDAGLGSNATLTLHAYTDDARGTKGYKRAQAIMSRVVRLLHGADLAVEGFDAVSCRYEFSESIRDLDLAGNPKRHIITTFRILAEAVPASLVPYRRDALRLEFIPAIDDASGLASSGQPFTKVGTPTLSGGGYLFDAGDAIRFAGAALADILNAGASGWTWFVAAQPATLGGGARSLLNHADAAFANDGLYSTLADRAAGAVGINAGVEYANGDFGGTDATGAIVPAGRNVIAMRFLRTGAAADSDARLAWFADGVRLAPVTEDPASPANASVVAGNLWNAAGDALYIGSVAGEAAYPRIGGVWFFTDALTDADVFAISTWIAANHPAL